MLHASMLSRCLIRALSRSARPNPERHIVRFDLFHVSPLARVLRRHHLLPERTRPPVLKHPPRRFVRLFGRHAHQRLHFRGGERPPMPGEVVVLLHDLHGLVDAVLLAFDGQPRVVEMGAHAQRILEDAHIFIQRAKERFDLSGNVNGTSHPIGRSSCYRNRVADGIPPRCAWLFREPLREKLSTP